MNFTGFDPDAIRQLVSNVNGFANETAQTIIDKLKNEIIIPMSKVWYTPDGVKFWTEFAEYVNGLSKPIAEAFNSFVDALGEAEKKWAEVTGAESIGIKGQISDLSMHLDVSEIKEKDGTRVGIVESEALAIAQKLNVVESELVSSLKEIASKLDADSSFIGRAQGAAVQACFGVVEGLVGKTFEFLSTDLATRIKEDAEAYGTFAQSAADAFNNAEAGK